MNNTRWVIQSLCRVPELFVWNPFFVSQKRTRHVLVSRLSVFSKLFICIKWREMKVSTGTPPKILQKFFRLQDVLFSSSLYNIIILYSYIIFLYKYKNKLWNIYVIINSRAFPYLATLFFIKVLQFIFTPYYKDVFRLYILYVHYTYINKYINIFKRRKTSARLNTIFIPLPTGNGEINKVYNNTVRGNKTYYL